MSEKNDKGGTSADDLDKGGRSPRESELETELAKEREARKLMASKLGKVLAAKSRGKELPDEDRPNSPAATPAGKAPAPARRGLHASFTHDFWGFPEKG